MNKKKVIVLSVIGFTIFCMLAAMTACTATFVNELEKEAEREEQRIEQQLEDEYLTEEDLPGIELPGQPEEPQLQQGEAIEVIRPYVDEAFGPTGLNYYLEEEVQDGITIVVLVIDISSDEVTAAMQTGEWNEISQLGVLASESMYQVLLSEGVDAHFGIAMGDVDLDEYYFAALDGELVMDMPNGVE